MRTDYQNLNSFEVSAVVLATAGLGLIATIVFSGLPLRQQELAISSLSMFDIHDQAIAQARAVNRIFAGERKLLDTFYMAFTEEMSLPPEKLQVPKEYVQIYNSFLTYSEGVAVDYQHEYSATPKLAYDSGFVSGASIDSSVQPSISCPGHGNEEALIIPYEFKPPDINLWRQKVESNISKLSN